MMYLACCAPAMWIAGAYARDRKPSLRAKLVGLIVVTLAVVTSVV